jgi:hypothetical protein
MDIFDQMQQEFFKKWAGLWPSFAAYRSGNAGQNLRFQGGFCEPVSKWAKIQGRVLETLCSAGLKNIEDAFRLAQAQDFNELRSKATEIWQRTVDCLQEAYETQIRCFQTVVGKMIDPVMKEGA